MTVPINRSETSRAICDILSASPCRFFRARAVFESEVVYDGTQSGFNRTLWLHPGTRSVLKRYVLCLLGANHTGIMAAVATALSELGGEIHKISQTVTEKLFT